MNEKNLLTITEAAKIKNVARATIYVWLDRGFVKESKFKNHRYIVNDESFKNASPARWARQGQDMETYIRTIVRDEIAKIKKKELFK
jgi:hypothetical protein